MSASDFPGEFGNRFLLLIAGDGTAQRDFAGCGYDFHISPAQGHVFGRDNGFANLPGGFPIRWIVALIAGGEGLVVAVTHVSTAVVCILLFILARDGIVGDGAGVSSVGR